MSLVKRILLALFLMALLGAALFIVRMDHFLKRPADRRAAPQVVVVRPGATLKDVARDLEERRMITGSRPFLLWARVKGYGRRIKAGEYEIGAHMSPEAILETLTRGRVITHATTFPEGLTRWQIADILAEKSLLEREAFLARVDDGEIVEKYGLKGKNLEGYLYPDTYNFSRGLSPETIVDVMVRRFKEVTDPLAPAVQRSGMTLAEVVTLASIVEKETGLASERALIAGVFLNRQKKGMRLESDPTVIYGIPEFDGNLTRKDLRRPTPYNTYRIKGLPPGPIANPGLEAIRAVLFPAETEYLFFVSKNDGSHHFSRSLKEHNQAVNRYQKRGRR